MTRIIPTPRRRDRKVSRSLRLGTRLVLVLFAVGLLSPVAGVPATSAAEGPSELEIVDLGTLPGGGSSFAHAINDHGHVVGESDVGDPADGNRHAFVWRRGRMIDLGTLQGPLGSSWALDINNHDQIVGVSSVETSPGLYLSHAVLWSDGRMIDLGALPGGGDSIATGINERGDVVGMSIAADGLQHAFLWRRGRMTDLGLFPGARSSRAEGIDNRGQVVGNSPDAVVWQDGEMSSLDLPPGAERSTALDINDRGVVVGVGRLPGVARQDRAVVWRHGVPRYLDIADPSGSWAQGINDRGQIVGFGWSTGAFLWERGVTVSLPSLVEDDCTAASDINEAGQIVGYSPVVDCVDPFRHAVIWR
jgi:probable HAF family extracellular repeat protein